MEKSENITPREKICWNPMESALIGQKEVTVSTHETSLAGLRRPFAVKQYMPFRNNTDSVAWWEANTTYAEQLKRDRTNITRKEVFNYLYNTQSDTLQPLIPDVALSALLERVNEVYDRGGGTRRLCTPPNVSDDGYSEVLDDFFPVFMRTFRDHLLHVPSDGSQLPEYEEFAAEVLEQVSHPHNLDWKVYCERADLPTIADSFVTGMITFLQKAEIQHTAHYISGKQIVELHIDDVDDFWHKYAVPGAVFDSSFTLQVVNRNKSVFCFSPVVDPKQFVIQIGIVNPPANPDFAAVKMSWGPAHDGQFLDLRDLYCSPMPTDKNGLNAVDQRLYDVNEVQRNMTTVFRRDGSVEIPDPDKYHQTQTTLSDSSLARIDGNPGRVLNELGRICRYGSQRATPERNNYSCDDASMHPTIETLFKLRNSLDNLICNGVEIPPHKLKEFWGNILVAAHNSAQFTIDMFQYVLLQHSFAFPHADCLKTIPHRQKPFNDARGVVFDTNNARLEWTSGISTLLRRVAIYTRKHAREQTPNGILHPVEPPPGSPLAQLFWIFDPVGDKLPKKTWGPDEYFTNMADRLRFQLLVE